MAKDKEERKVVPQLKIIYPGGDILVKTFDTAWSALWDCARQHGRSRSEFVGMVRADS